MRTKGSYLGHYPLVGSGGIQGIDGIYTLNQTFSLRDDTNYQHNLK